MMFREDTGKSIVHSFTFKTSQLRRYRAIIELPSRYYLRGKNIIELLLKVLDFPGSVRKRRPILDIHW
jgi:hypothetical protein